MKTLTFEDTIAEFEQRVRQRSPKSSTAKHYASDWQQFARACPKAPESVTVQDVDEYVAALHDRNLKPASINRKVAALKRFFELLGEKIADPHWENPVRSRRHTTKKGKHLPRDLSDETAARLWAVIDDVRDQAIFGLMLRGGLRVREVAELEISGMYASPEAGQPARLRVSGKGDKERVVYVSAEAYELVQAYLAIRPQNSSPRVFLNHRGQPISVNGIQYRLDQYTERAGVQATCHQLRHTFARQMAEAEMPVTSLAKQLGHESLTTTQLYIDGADPQLQRSYQAALNQLETQPPPSPSQAPSPVPEATPANDDRPLWEPDWAHCLPDLATELREPAVDYLRRRLRDWRPSRRKRNYATMYWHLKSVLTFLDSERGVPELLALNPADLQAYIDKCQQAGQAATTINRSLAALQGVLLDWEAAGHPLPLRLTRLPRLQQPKALPNPLPEAEAQAWEHYMLAQLHSDSPTVLALDVACFFLFAHTGLRRSELSDLQRADLDLDNHRLFIRDSKGRRDRLVFLSATAKLALERYLHANPRPAQVPLWVLPDGRPVTYTMFYNRLRSLADQTELPWASPHRWRHTFATRMLNAGMPITSLQKLLGHEHVSTTLRYAGLSDETLEQDYRRALAQVERTQMPLDKRPISVDDWPQTEPVPAHSTEDLCNPNSM